MTDTAGVALFPFRTRLSANDICGFIMVHVRKETWRSDENGFINQINTDVFIEF